MKNIFVKVDTEAKWNFVQYTTDNANYGKHCSVTWSIATRLGGKQGVCIGIDSGYFYCDYQINFDSVNDTLISFEEFRELFNVTYKPPVVLKLSISEEVDVDLKLDLVSLKDNRDNDQIVMTLSEFDKLVLAVDTVRESN